MNVIRVGRPESLNPTCIRFMLSSFSLYYYFYTRQIITPESLITATPINYLYLEYTSHHLKLKGWLYIAFIFLPTFKKKDHFIGNLWEELVPFHCYSSKEAPLYKVSLGGGSSFSLNCAENSVGWSFIFCSEQYLKGWSFRLNYFIDWPNLPGGLHNAGNTAVVQTTLLDN